ncbi:purine-nucleoside phosphorylase [Psychroflexus lacisalsi]|jgi:purine-nucleoside phosphorylase|uniref:Uridine phosphorylase n=1 Tax=Psychroflexus lacisalsi TaxID=503928 RepID=A0ABP3VIJ7_9FLAO|nr:purine-nucleoside phosphorylase [Psychroflexus lacisalsi]MBZ9619970.1 purine-nucleoside phosphorylase [Psychroflexus lacisalsi]
MSIHIDAKKGDIAETILLPGDPLRAKWIAETFLENVTCYNEVRGMLGYTGTYQGHNISVQGTGMGIPSISIYAHELITEFGVKNLIRVGSAGAIKKEVEMRDVVIAMAASTNSSLNRNRFNGGDFAPTASFKLFDKAITTARELNISFKAGNVLSSDLFYTDDPLDHQMWAAYNVLCVEMEAAGLYSIAAKHDVNALAILTISDSLITGEKTSAQERETTFNQMIKIALELAD